MANQKKKEEYYGERCEKCESYLKCHSGYYRVTCELCNKTYATKYALKKHMKAVHPDNQPIPTYPFACDICNKTFRKKKFLTFHKRTHNRKKIICKICSKPLASRCSLRGHNIWFHRDEYFKSVRRHEITKEKQKKKKEEDAIKNECIMCGKKFKDQYHLFEHLRKHTDEKPYICKICDEEYRYKVQLAKHYVKMHGAEGRKQWEKMNLKKSLTVYKIKRRLIYRCSICVGTSDRASRMLEHVVELHGANASTATRVMKELKEKKEAPPLTRPRTQTKVLTKPNKQRGIPCKKTTPLPPPLNTCYVCGERFHCKFFSCFHIKRCQKMHQIFVKTDMPSLETTKENQPCKVCGKNLQLLRRTGRREHVKNCGNTRCCPSCHRDLTNEEDKLGHIAKCFQRKKFKCPNCPATFSDERNIFEHLRHGRCRKPKFPSCEDD